ncbi:MAG: LD-carboxypeptidase [Oligoflexia bacterium]|nr:LD-carboxypeptidase [Oligoflexia bacterium]
MIKKPHILNKGDAVAIVALSSFFDREMFNKSLKVIKSMGLKPIFDKSVFNKDFIFAGSAKTRLNNLIKAMKNPKAKAIWCVRGGYGAYDIAQELALKKIKTSSKILIGYSDVSALHFYFNQKLKWPTLHGPLFTRLGKQEYRGLEKKVLEETLFNFNYRLKVNLGLKVLGAKKNVTGVLTGGNLSLIAGSIGTLWEIDTKNKILFIEEIAESGKKIDRLLAQLWHAGKFDHVKAVVFGDFTDCLDGRGQLWLESVKRRFSKASFPVLLGLKAGHDKINLTLPFGVKVKVSAVTRPCFEVIEGFARE